MKTKILASMFVVSSMCSAQVSGSQMTDRERMLLEKINQLEERLSAMERRSGGAMAAPVSPNGSVTAAPVAGPQTGPATVPAIAGTEAGPNQWLKDTTLNFYFDGYYAWNTNRPLGRVNLLRAYDTTANNFSINQTGMIIERAVDPAAGKRWGYRLDLMYGQATETLQGGAQNEPRPQAYRNVFQAYGTYVAPVGKGLSMDFGKWSSSLGPEGNYTKDQINYSRSYFFNFLPFYHTGFRTVYPVSDKVSVAYWLVNGANQAEDFNSFKSQLGQVVVKPTKDITWTLQYYNGQEQRDLVPALNPGIPTIPTQPGLSTTRVGSVPRGRFHVIDTYLFWNATSKMTLGGEFDYVVNRVETNSTPTRVLGGAGYFKYQLTPKVHFGQRYARLNDTGGLFSGVTQKLNDLTSTVGIKLDEGAEFRLEYRRDFSNVPFFLSSAVDRLKKEQNTFTLGMLWWFGGKQGGW